MTAFVDETFNKINEMKDADLQQIFDAVKEKLLLEWKNFYLEKSYLQCFRSWDNLIFDNSFQPKQLAELLQNYTYEQFATQLKTWLVQGRTVWFASGNLTQDQAIAMVEHQAALMKLQPLAVTDLNGANPVKVAAGEYHRVNVPLTDATNENSALISFFETGISSQSIKNDLTSKLVM